MKVYFEGNNFALMEETVGKGKYALISITTFELYSEVI
jgi:hypothetical protein